MGKKEAEMFHREGMSYLGQGKIREALENFNKATTFDYDYFPAWNNKGIAHLELKEYQQALNCFEHVIRINALDRMVWYNKGYALMMLGKDEEAVSAFGNFLHSYSKNDDDFYKYALYMQARGLYNLKKYDKAAELLQSLLVIDENFMEAQKLFKEIERKNNI